MTGLSNVSVAPPAEFNLAFNKGYRHIQYIGQGANKNMKTKTPQKPDAYM